ncbi:hypothetical protein ABPG77_004806 [Micractinium sp. CCAP 211/92]
MPPQVPANPDWSRRPLLVLCAALLERCLGRHVKGWQGAASKYDTCVHCERPPNRRSVQSGDESTGRRQAGWQLSSCIMQIRMLFSPHLCWRGQTKGQPAGSTPQPTAAVLWTLRTLPLQLQSHKKGGLRTYATRVCTCTCGLRVNVEQCLQGQQQTQRQMEGWRPKRRAEALFAVDAGAA